MLIEKLSYVEFKGLITVDKLCCQGGAHPVLILIDIYYNKIESSVTYVSYRLLYVH